MAMAWVGAAAFVLVAVLTEFVRRLAIHLALTDRPGARKGHNCPTPYLGGVVIVAGVLAPTILGGDPRLRAILLPAAAVALLGLVDDVRPLSAHVRLAVEGAAAVAVIAGAGHMSVFGNWLDYVVPVLWIVVITNSFNLLDNMDGAAASVACATSAVLALPALMTGQRSVGVLLVALSCGCAGFLPHNWTPARIFMGDAGSLFIGFVVASSALLVFAPSAHGTRVAGPLMGTFVATVDTCVVMVSRRRAGRPLMLGGTDHVSHRLRRLGLSTWQVAFTLSGTAALTCLAAIPIVRGWVPAAIPLAGAVILGAFLVWALQKVPVYATYDDRSPAPARVPM
jgi:UDP-GlcNAc:undecaprenyl-phosphate GlcNAc-1-phosphate transferase